MRPIERLSLQTAHRLGALALLATLAAWALVYRGQDFRWPIIIAFAAANVGFCAAWLARMLGRRDQRNRREATGAMIFNLVFLLLSLQLMLLARLDVIRAAAEKFFTPS
jgi:predicted PurR-regulated permease PerM